MTVRRILSALTIAGLTAAVVPATANAAPPETTITCGTRTFSTVQDVWAARGYKTDQECSVSVTVDQSVPLEERFTADQTAALTLLNSEPRYWAGWGLPSILDVCASRDASAVAAINSWPSMEAAAKALCPSSPVWGKDKKNCDKDKKNRGHDHKRRNHRR